MSEPWDAEVFRVPDLAWQIEVPPARFPIPVQYARELEVGDEVTIGLPGQYFIDGQVLARADRKAIGFAGHADEVEALAVAAPYAYWLAKAFPKAGLTMQWWPVVYSWTYRDAARPGEHRHEQAAAPHNGAGSWLEHVLATLDEPPTRKPRPARLAGSLAGRPLRMQHQPGMWSWWMAVSEPANHIGDFVVHVMRPSDYWLCQVVSDSTEIHKTVPLHRLFVYE